MATKKGLLGGRKLSLLQLGSAFLIVGLVVGVLVFEKNRIGVMLKPGASITIEFKDKIGLREFISQVKVAGVPVGKVSSIDRKKGDLTEVVVKVDSNIPKILDTAPTARVRATTLLGGNYYVDLRPGGIPGEFDGTIPIERTSQEVELDQVVAALQPDARRGIGASIRDLDATLSSGGSAALRDLTHDAPQTLGPAGDVLTSLRGTRPDTDLTEMIHGLEGVSRALADKEVHLDGLVADLGTTTSVLSHRSGDLAAWIHGMPETLRSSDIGLAKLDTTLRDLRDTSDPARPSVKELGSLMKRLDPVVAKAVPVVHDLRHVMNDLRPAVDDLRPTSQNLTSVFDDLRGPVLDRTNGPILNVINSPYRGSGPYAHTSGDDPFYKELAYMVTNLDRAAETRDRNGAAIAFEPGSGPGTAAGLPLSFEKMLTQFTNPQEGGR